MTNKLDLLLASLILALSLGVAGYSYGSVRRIEQTSFSISTLAKGKSEYQIASHGVCVGKVSVEVFDDRALALELLSTINTTYLGRLLQANLTIQSVFNPLGQMQTTTAKLVGKDFQVSVDTNGVNPAKASIRAQVSQDKYHYDLSVPGPLLLVKKGDRYSLDYPRLASTKREYFSVMTNPLLKKLALEISSIQEKSCTVNATAGIELDSLIESLSSFEFLAKQLGAGV